MESKLHIKNFNSNIIFIIFNWISNKKYNLISLVYEDLMTNGKYSKWI